MAALKDIKIWKNPAKTETRIYVHTDDDREGVIYRTGNKWHAANSVDGNLTEDEWQKARDIAFYDGKWHTVYENEMPAQTTVVTETTEVVETTETQETEVSEVTEIAEARRFRDGETFKWIVDGNYYVVISAEHGHMIDFEGDRMPTWFHQVRRATEAEIDAFNTPMTQEQKDAFWNEFFDRTDYIGS